MKSLLVYCPDPGDATSFYRGCGPFQRLRKEVPDLDIMFVGEMAWPTVGFADAVFMQRPYTLAHLQAAEIVKSSNVPLWLDYDDDLFCVPTDNPAFQFYGPKDCQERIARLCTMADAISVSTPAIKRRLEGLNRNVTVVPNALDDWKLGYWQPRRSPRERMVMWRGGHSHQRDLMYVTQEILKVSRDPRHKDWVFQFQGYNPFWLTDAMRDTHTIVAPAMDVMNYHRFIHDICPALMVVPLVPNQFNVAKSNIAWIEGTFAGATVVAPDMPEWRLPGVINYHSAEDFAEVLSGALEAPPKNLEALNAKSWDHIHSCYLLSQTNAVRRAILDDLVSRPRGIRMGIPEPEKQRALIADLKVERPAQEDDGDLSLG